MVFFSTARPQKPHRRPTRAWSVGPGGLPSNWGRAVVLARCGPTDHPAIGGKAKAAALLWQQQCDEAGRATRVERARGAEGSDHTPKGCIHIQLTHPHNKEGLTSIQSLVFFFVTRTTD